MKTSTLALIGVLVAALAAIFVVAVPTWQRPPHLQDLGYRGLGLVQFSHPRDHKAIDDPPPLIPVSVGASPAGAFKNVKVLSDLSPGDFMRLQYAMTEWVAPKQGCGYCHAGNDYASDANPRKQVARVMLAMTRHINADWRQHVGAEGVTCDTCHRGQPMPPKAWFLDTPRLSHGILGKPAEFNEAAETVRDFFPQYGWAEYFLQDTPIHVESRTSIPTGQISDPTEAARVYEMMMQMADGIGVNCTYCHNSQDFATWSQSPPGRWAGYYGIKMTRDLNQHYVYALRTVMPQARLGPNRVMPPTGPRGEMGPLDGNGLVNCATCHIGDPNPMNGANMLKDYPELAGSPHVAGLTPTTAATPGAAPSDMATYVAAHSKAPG